VWVDEQAVIRNSIIMEDTFIGRYAVIDHCVLDERVSIGEHCNVGLGRGLSRDGQGITVVGKGVTVPPYMTIERNCKVLPHVRLSDSAINNEVSPVAL